MDVSIIFTLQVTSSPLSLKRNPSSVSACSGSSSVAQGPASPLRRAVSSVSSVSGASVVTNGSAEAGHHRRMVAASPCSCGLQQPLQTMQGHENYDIPRNLGRQVRASSVFCVLIIVRKDIMCGYPNSSKYKSEVT